MLTIAVSGVLVLLHNDTVAERERVENTVSATIPPGRNSQYTKSNSHVGLLQYKELQSYSDWFYKNTSPDFDNMTMPTTSIISDEAKFVSKPTMKRNKNA